MAEIEIPYFGKINTEKVEEYYYLETELDRQKIRLDLNFENSKIDVATVAAIRGFLNKILEIKEMNINEYTKDFSNGGKTEDYLEFYLEELLDDELEELIDTSQDEIGQKKQLLDKLELKRVGLYPDIKYEVEYFGVFDYSIKIDGEFCDQLLVLKTNEKGELDHITWES